MLGRLALVLCLSSGLSFADETSPELMAKMEKAVAVSAGCSFRQPCNIEISKIDNGFSAKVVRAAQITEDGVLKYLPSASYYQLSKEGEIVSTNPTP